MSPDNSMMVICGGEVVAVAGHNAVVVDDVTNTFGVAAVDGVMVGVGVVAALIVWVQ